MVQLISTAVLADGSGWTTVAVAAITGAFTIAGATVAGVVQSRSSDREATTALQLAAR